jgi:hypothetical protein
MRPWDQLFRKVLFSLLFQILECFILNARVGYTDTQS